MLTAILMVLVLLAIWLVWLAYSVRRLVREVQGLLGTTHKHLGQIEAHQARAHPSFGVRP